MITSAISSAARLTLAPAKLAAQMAGTVVRKLRTNGSGEGSSARRSASSKPARAKAARRSGTQAQTKRAATRSTGKQQPKRAAKRSSAKQPAKRSAGKAQPKRTGAQARTKTESSPAAQSKPTPAPTSAQAPPKRADQTEPRGDVAIAREVESTIFQDIEADRDQVDVNVAEGVVRLRGEVGTPDLIRELEARAARVPQVRRVENLLRTPAPPSEPQTPVAPPVDPASTPGMGSGEPAESGGGARAPRVGRWGDKPEPLTETREGALEPAGRTQRDESADPDEPGSGEPDTDRVRELRDLGPRGPHGS